MIALALLCAALIGLIVYMLRHAATQERAWTQERQLLISRIQHPEIVPVALDVAEQMTVEVPRPEEDESHLVGTIQDHGYSE